MKTFLNFEITNKVISKKLKQLGLNQNHSLFYYNPNKEIPVPCKEANPDIDYASFTLAQLGYLIPDQITKNDKTFVIVLKKDQGQILFEGNEVQSVNCETEVEMRGKLLIVLLEAKLLDIEQLNKKLNEFGYDYVVPF